MRIKSAAILSLFLTITSLICLLGNNDAWGKGPSFPIYGSGKIQVRLYTDYFCPPCRETEPIVESILLDLVKKGSVQLTLVDTPFSRLTPEYARFFLYAIHERNNLEHAFKIRNILFDSAASEQVKTKEQMEALLRSQTIPYSIIDVSRVFKLFNSLIKEDRIQATPTCVIVRDGKKEIFSGKATIVNALKQLR